MRSVLYGADNRGNSTAILTATARDIISELKAIRANWGRPNLGIQKWDTEQIPQNRKQEGNGRMEYRERKRRIIEPIPDERLVSYAKPIRKLRTRPNQIYKIICGRISYVESDQILAALGGDLERFQNETVDLFQGGLEDAMGRSKNDDLESKFYLYLGDLCRPTRKLFGKSESQKIGGSEPVGYQENSENQWANSE